jgi:hypothetical protein
MTKARTWPTNVATHRDRAAEELSASVRKLELLLAGVERGEFTRDGLERTLWHILKHNTTAIRHLESAGAQTRPD